MIVDKEAKLFDKGNIWTGKIIIKQVSVKVEPPSLIRLGQKREETKQTYILKEPNATYTDPSWIAIFECIGFSGGIILIGPWILNHLCYLK